jgi:hypothetical protein
MNRNPQRPRPITHLNRGRRPIEQRWGCTALAESMQRPEAGRSARRRMHQPDDLLSL